MFSILPIKCLRDVGNEAFDRMGIKAVVNTLFILFNQCSVFKVFSILMH